jgi:glyoxylase-like metal-dependent hydrolase (beta-lactamase superfamily II)
MDFGKFRLSIIRESYFRLDGGAMFGVVPKTLWDKVSAPDELNRVRLACNLLLIESPAGNVLVETGMGPRWSQRERERFDLQTVVDHSAAVVSAGLKNEDIDHVIVSHMHFDHIGGAVIERDGALVPAFPKAIVHVQKGELELAGKVNSRGRASYRADDYTPLLEHGRLAIMDGNTEILPGIRAQVTGGHTSHHQIVTFESEGHKGVYFADIVPTRNHLAPPWVMGYDHYPLQSCDAKDEWLVLAARENWLVVFDHEVDVPWGYVQQSSSGKFEWRPLDAETLAPNTIMV